MRRIDDPVEVRRGADADPDQFLWHGRLWSVREVVSHWVETGAWWAARDAATTTGDHGRGSTDLLHETECWRVTAARGRLGDLGVFDLVLSWADGGWRLVRALDRPPHHHDPCRPRRPAPEETHP